MSLNDFVIIYKIKNTATSNKNVPRVLSSIGLNNIVIYLRDEPFSSDIGIVKLHPTKRTDWVAYITENCFGSYGCAPSQKLSKFIIKRHRWCLCSEYKIQGLTNERDTYCASYCLYILHLTNFVGIDFKSSVLNLYYQMIK